MAVGHVKRPLSQQLQEEQKGNFETASCLLFALNCAQSSPSEVAKGDGEYMLSSSRPLFHYRPRYLRETDDVHLQPTAALVRIHTSVMNLLIKQKL